MVTDLETGEIFREDPNAVTDILRAGRREVSQREHSRALWREPVLPPVVSAQGNAVWTSGLQNREEVNVMF